MSVEKDPTRKAITIRWDKGAIKAKLVDIQATNISATDPTTWLLVPNDGVGVLTFDGDFEGVTQVRIVGWIEEELVPTAQAETAIEELRDKMAADPPDERLGVEKGEIEVT